MRDRRQGGREKVLLGDIAEINDRSSTMDGVVGNVSERGVCAEVDEAVMVSHEIQPNIPRKGRSFLADMISRQAGRVSLAFRTMVTDRHSNDLDERLRRSQIKQRQLKRRIEDLLGEG